MTTAPATPAAPQQEAVWVPQPGPQVAACQCPLRDLFYGGQRGGGKSDYLLGDWLQHKARYGGKARGILFRRTYKELDELRIRSQMLYPKTGAKFLSSKDEFRWVWPDGASLVMRHMQHNKDADLYEGHQYTWQGFDQVEKWPSPEPVDKLWGSLRSPHGIPCVRRLTGNPPAPGWVRERYITNRKPGLPFDFQPQPELRPELKIRSVWIRARLEDNLILMREQPEYEAHLAMAGMAEGGEALFRAWRYGDWEAFIGQVFKEWRREYHVVKDFRPPPSWRFAAALDWGYRHHGCFVLFGTGPDGDVVALEEFYFREQHAQAAGYAAGLLCLPYPAVEYIAADHDMWKQTGVSAPTLAEEFQVGIWQAYNDRRDLAPALIEATKGRGSRRAKLVLMHRYLEWHETELEDGQRIVQPWNRPRLHFHERCQACIRTIPGLPYAETGDTEDVDTEAEDHPYDAVTIFLMSRPPLAEPIYRTPEPDQHPGFDPAARKRKRRWQEAMEEQMRPGAAMAAGSGYRVPRDYIPLEEG